MRNYQLIAKTFFAHVLMMQMAALSSLYFVGRGSSLLCLIVKLRCECCSLCVGPLFTHREVKKGIQKLYKIILMIMSNAVRGPVEMTLSRTVEYSRP